MRHTMWKSLIDILPRGNTLDEADWQRRHRLLQWVLLAHVPVLAVIGVALGNPPLPLAIALAIPVVCAGAGRLLATTGGSGRRPSPPASCGARPPWWASPTGHIESHFHFFIIIGFIALYQDWVPFLLNVLFTVLTHGVGSMWLRTLMFNHPAAQAAPVALVAHPRRRGAARLRRRDAVLAGHRGRAEPEGRPHPQAAPTPRSAAAGSPPTCW